MPVIPLIIASKHCKFFRVQIQDIKWSNSPGSNIMQAQVCNMLAFKKKGFRVISWLVTNLWLIWWNLKALLIRNLYWFDWQVFFVDEGRVKDVSIIKLYELPPHLKSYPFQVCMKEMDIDISTANKDTPMKSRSFV